MAAPQDLERKDRTEAKPGKAPVRAVSVSQNERPANETARHAVESSDSTLDAVRLLIESEGSPPVRIDKTCATGLPEGKRDARAAMVGSSGENASAADGSRQQPHGKAVLPDLEQQCPYPRVHAGESVGERSESRFRRGMAALWGRLSPHIVNRRTAIGAGLVAVIWWKPWLIPGLIFALIWIGLIVYLTVGPDRLAELAEPVKQRLAARFPDKAAALRRRIERGQESYERLVNKLPENWRDRVPLPELGATTELSADLEGRPDPFDRLSAERDRDLGRA